MKRWIATTALALLFSGAAAGDPGNAPSVDTTAAWAGVEQQADANLERTLRDQDASVERALRNHKASAEALRDVGDCNPASSEPGSGAVSATERHTRLTTCLAQRRANEGLVAGNPN